MTTVLSALRTSLEVDMLNTAPLQSDVPAGRKTRVSPADAWAPRTSIKLDTSGAMTEGSKETSGGEGGGMGGGGEEGGGVGGSGGGGNGGKGGSGVAKTAVSRAPGR